MSFSLGFSGFLTQTVTKYLNGLLAYNQSTLLSILFKAMRPWCLEHTNIKDASCNPLSDFSPSHSGHYLLLGGMLLSPRVQSSEQLIIAAFQRVDKVPTKFGTLDLQMQDGRLRHIQDSMKPSGSRTIYILYITLVFSCKCWAMEICSARAFTS